MPPVIPRTTLLFSTPAMAEVRTNLPQSRPRGARGTALPRQRILPGPPVRSASRPGIWGLPGGKCPTPGHHGIKKSTLAAGEFPRRFGSYVLLKQLARGGMGELDLAVTGGRGMEKLCVIKRVLPHLLASDSVQRFREEAMVV